MQTFKTFEQNLHEGLANLHDPTYQPPALLWEVLGCQPQQEGKSFQAAIIQAIEALKPTAAVAHQDRSRRIHVLLTYRYVQGLTQEATAERMGFTPRHVRRIQDQAVHGLAQSLWSQRRWEKSERGVASPIEQTGSTEIDGAPLTSGARGETDPWRAQVQQELAAMQQNAPAAVSHMGSVIEGVVKVGQALTAKHHTQLTVAPIPDELTAAIHPVALRQILLTAIEKLVNRCPAGEITLRIEMARNVITISVAGGPTVAGALPNSDLIQSLLADPGGALHIYRSGETIVFQITLPSTAGAADTEAVPVLVVDDNADLVTFYQLYAANTRYQIIHLADAQRLFDTIATEKPDAIVLDVLLPDMDGWELLTYLHEHPDTRAIPVIICSVIRREDLALALGAALYLAKPIRRQEFVQALDRVCNRVAA